MPHHPAAEPASASGGSSAGAAAADSAKRMFSGLQDFFSGGGAGKAFERVKQDVVHEVKGTTPAEWAIAGSISLFLALIYNSITKSKDDSALNFTTLVAAAVMTFAAVVVRVKDLPDQYAWSVVFLTVFGVLSGLSPLSILFLGAVPPAINYIRVELKKSH